MSVNEQYSKFKPLIFVSGIYLLLIIIFSISDISEFKTMPPNAWGDFLAGTFAPLAFMWLVFGYRQQGEELKQNTEALKLQAEELKNSVEQQKVLVETAKEELTLVQNKDNRQIKLETIQAQPYFHFKDVKLVINERSSENTLHLKFTNSRATCRDLAISIVLKSEYDGAVVELIELVRGGGDDIYECNVQLNFKNNDFKEINFAEDVQFRYSDSYDEKRIQKFKFTVFRSYPEDQNSASVPHFFANQYYESYKSNN